MNAPKQNATSQWITYDSNTLKWLKNQLRDTIAYILQDRDLVPEKDIERLKSIQEVYDFWNTPDLYIDEKWIPKVKAFKIPVGFIPAKVERPVS